MPTPVNTFYICEPGSEEVRGPFTESQLKGLWERGEMNANTLMRDESGFGAWQSSTEYLWLLEKEEPKTSGIPSSQLNHKSLPQGRRVSDLTTKEIYNGAVYRILAFFFGVLGVHNFYAGEKNHGYLKIILSLLIIGCLVTGTINESYPWTFAGWIISLLTGILLIAECIRGKAWD